MPCYFHVLLVLLYRRFLLDSSSCCPVLLPPCASGLSHLGPRGHLLLSAPYPAPHVPYCSHSEILHPPQSPRDPVLQRLTSQLGNFPRFCWPPPEIVNFLMESEHLLFYSFLIVFTLTPWDCRQHLPAGTPYCFCENYRLQITTPVNCQTRYSLPRDPSRW